MEKQLFEDLLESVRQGVAIRQGKMQAAAVREYELPNVKHLRGNYPKQWV